MRIRLFERLRKLRFPGHRKAENPLPVRTWESMNQEAERELLEQVQEDAEQDILALQEAMRGPN